MWYVNFTIKGGLPTSSSQRSAFIIGDVLFHSPFLLLIDVFFEKYIKV